MKVDGSQIEWRSYLEWSRDPVGIGEIHDVMVGKSESIHIINQNYFKLPTKLIAKTFLFRYIYRGSAYAFANDPDFTHVSRSDKYWQKVIDAANEKYHVLYKFQDELIRKVQDGEIITIPSGREFQFSMKKNKKGEFYWNIRDIVNWPNQGFAADIMIIARVSLFNRLRKLDAWKQGKIKLFNTVHDDVELDCDHRLDNGLELCYNISIEMEKVFADIPANFERLYKSPFIVPLAGEVSFGNNLLDLTKFDKSKGKGQFLETKNKSN